MPASRKRAVSMRSGGQSARANFATAKAELEGLDIPEMGSLGYPEFVLKAE